MNRRRTELASKNIDRHTDFDWRRTEQEVYNRRRRWRTENQSEGQPPTPPPTYRFQDPANGEHLPGYTAAAEDSRQNESYLLSHPE